MTHEIDGVVWTFRATLSPDGEPELTEVRGTDPYGNPVQPRAETLIELGMVALRELTKTQPPD